MSASIKKKGENFALGDLSFSPDQVDINFDRTLYRQGNRKGVAALVIKPKQGAVVNGLVWLSDNQELEVEIGGDFCLIAEKVEGRDKAYKELINFFFSS